MGKYLNQKNVRKALHIPDSLPDWAICNYEINQNYKIEIVPAKSLEKGINEFNVKRLTDLVVVISMKHSLFYNLFAESNTRNIAFDTKVPVMAIHE